MENKIKKKYEKSIVVIFFGLIVIGGIGSFIPFDIYKDTFQENRKLATITSLKDLNCFNKKLNSYINDNFGMRKSLLRLYFYVKMKILKSDLQSERFIGKNGWLFYKATIDDYQRKNQLTKEELEEIGDNLKIWNKYFSKKGIDFFVMIAPNKATIYPEYMPKYLLVRNTISRYDQIVTFLRDYCSIKVVDVRNALKRIKNDGYLVYFEWGTHWTSLGAAIAWEEIKKEIDKENKSYIWLNSKRKIAFRNALKYEEDGWIHYGWPNDTEREIPIAKYDFNSQIKAKENKRPINHGQTKEINMLVFGDSFSEFLSEYGNAFVSTVNYQYNTPDKHDVEIVKSYNPNIVVFELVERHIGMLQNLKLPSIDSFNDIFFDENNSIITVNSEKKDIVERDCGYLDNTQKGKDHVIFSGWAVDYRNGIPAQSVLIFVDNRIVAMGKPEIDRGDIAESNPSLTKSGFYFKVNNLSLTRRNKISVYALLNGNIASELKYFGTALDYRH